MDRQRYRPSAISSVAAWDLPQLLLRRLTCVNVAAGRWSRDSSRTARIRSGCDAVFDARRRYRSPLRCLPRRRTESWRFARNCSQLRPRVHRLADQRILRQLLPDGAARSVRSLGRVPQTKPDPARMPLSASPPSERCAAFRNAATQRPWEHRIAVHQLFYLLVISCGAPASDSRGMRHWSRKNRHER